MDPQVPPEESEVIAGIKERWAAIDPTQEQYGFEVEYESYLVDEGVGMLDIFVDKGVHRFIVEVQIYPAPDGYSLNTTAYHVAALPGGYNNADKILTTYLMDGISTPSDSAFTRLCNTAVQQVQQVLRLLNETYP